MENNKFPREISLCLSGGAAKGAFHLGCISILEEHNIEIKAISGTSIGALIGASIASGKSAKEILEIFKSKEFKSIFKFTFTKSYLYKIDMQSPVLEELVNKHSFEELKIPLVITVTNIDNAKCEYLSRGTKLHEYILASCAISPIVEPKEIEGNLYVDGGVTDNFPVEVLQKYPYKILGINLYPFNKKRPSSLIGWIKKIIFIAWHAPNLAKKQACDFYVSSDKLNDISLFSFKNLDKSYELGRNEMKSHIMNKM
ncbi:MAG: patatin-like phospholipase family protein [Sulfurimonas sp.]|nr:patatin-like phospholipase family protein [Sulfurimonas sp.]